MDKNGNITITDWIKGMAQSAILGNETIIINKLNIKL
jgi:hypothetical protein